MSSKKKKPSCPPKTAVIYARYSSASQRDVSIEQQIADIRHFAEREGYTIVHEYADRAKSGFKNISSRIEFRAMLAAAADGGFDTVIAWKVDRFGRNRRESALYKGQLRDCGVSVIYAMEPIPMGAAGVLTEGMLESIAEWYSRNLAENVSRGMRDNALRGLSNGARILGYKRGPDGRYVIDPDNAAVVRRIFERYNEGFSAAYIAKELDAAGLKTAFGSHFTPTHVLRIIENERYTGVYIWNDIRIEGAMPVIIDTTTFERAQQMRTKTGRHIESSPADFILTGKVFCGLCGRPMVGDSGTSKTGAAHYYYTCTGHKVRGGAVRTCSKKSVRKDELEKDVISFVYDRCLTGPEREKIADAIITAQTEYDKSSPRAAMEAELKETEKKISNINDAIENGIWNSSTSVRLKSLEDSAEALRTSLAELNFSRSQLLDRERILFFLDQMTKYDRDDPIRRKQLIQTFINAVFVYDDKYKIVINAVEGNSTVALSDLPPDSSDSVTDGVLIVTHPNLRIIIYTIPLAG